MWTYPVINAHKVLDVLGSHLEQRQVRFPDVKQCEAVDNLWMTSTVQKLLGVN